MAVKHLIGMMVKTLKIVLLISIVIDDLAFGLYTKSCSHQQIKSHFGGYFNCIYLTMGEILCDDVQSYLPYTIAGIFYSCR